MKTTTTTAKSSNYLTTTERARAIRKELKKAHGWTSRQVSVRKDSYSMGASIYVVIRDASVSKSDVEAIANKQQSVRCCEASGEILNGGNIYVSVKYSAEASGPLTDEIAAILTGEYQRFGRVYVDRDDVRDEWQCWQLDESGNVGSLAHRGYDKRTLARCMAEAHLSGELVGLDLSSTEKPAPVAPDYQAELWATHSAIESAASDSTNAQIDFLTHIGAV